jgi:anti-sigma factor RsiW
MTHRARRAQGPHSGTRQHTCGHEVNRYPTEGRQALAIRLAGTEGGIDCAKLAPRLLALLDGEASPDEVAQLQLHMKTCLSCRARLKSARAD